MTPAIIDLITIGVIAVLYAFLFWVARSMRSHLGRKEGRAPERRLEVRGVGGGPPVAASLSAPVVIGRSPDADVVIDDPFASDFHARIGPAGDGSFRIQDLGSTNGTFVDGNRITGPVSVGMGSEIQIGRTIMGIR